MFFLVPPLLNKDEAPRGAAPLEQPPPLFTKVMRLRCAVYCANTDLYTPVRDFSSCVFFFSILLERGDSTSGKSGKSGKSLCPGEHIVVGPRVLMGSIPLGLSVRALVWARAGAPASIL